MCSHMFCVVWFPLTKKGLHSSLLQTSLWNGSPGATAVPRPQLCPKKCFILFCSVFHTSYVSSLGFFNVGLKNVGLHVFYFWTKFKTTYLWVWFCASKNVKLRRWVGNILWRMFLELPAHWTKSKRKCVFSCIFGTCRDMCIYYVFYFQCDFCYFLWFAKLSYFNVIFVMILWFC